MHIPKCGGSSIRAALEQALPSGWLAPQGYLTDSEPADLTQLTPQQRSEFATSLEEMRSIGQRYRAITGHFNLDTLLEITDATRICTVVREPRTRVLSVYLYSLVPGVAPDWAYNPTLHDPRPLGQFLLEVFRAPQIDNVLCRMLLGDDPRLPAQDVVAESDVPAIALDAIARLGSLGYFGVLELEESVWQGISRMFGVKLNPARVRVTGEPAFTPRPLGSREPLFDAECLRLLEQRCAADAIVYDRALAQAGIDAQERARIKDAAFAAELVKLGDLIGNSERPAPNPQVQRLEDALRRSHEELDATRHWLDSVQTSASWRLTAPLRSAKRRLSPSNHRRAV